MKERRAWLIERFVALPPQERTFEAYLGVAWREVRSRPGIRLTLTSLGGFGAIIVIRKGWTNFIVTLGVAIIVLLVLSYFDFRKLRRERAA